MEDASPAQKYAVGTCNIGTSNASVRLALIMKLRRLQSVLSSYAPVGHYFYDVSKGTRGNVTASFFILHGILAVDPEDANSEEKTFDTVIAKINTLRSGLDWLSIKNIIEELPACF